MTSISPKRIQIGTIFLPLPLNHFFLIDETMMKRPVEAIRTEERMNEKQLLDSITNKSG
ncbi:hypothetical protein [Endozoicomonas sp. OPT23]|uniref:hypothetical protein n=1 Tax=Endozoicomonas sp. OPT23 TaxID=2072845 RepID=UPI00129B5295|nr:hypothetical protein [Endozoicomonas sp. OPT23]